ncbi:hypothetical protein ACTXG6_33970 [Pseudonocardia sp. Cha107L01]|uniref:hypothetical protein n=1 Tax=Pseudonocardia sp. Cha107L01 TaxID=3457576 RepID=UPI00403EB986
MDIADSARKHGVADDDMRHAVAQSMRVVRQGSADRVLVIGPDRVGALLELVVLDPDTEPVIIHAMVLPGEVLPIPGEGVSTCHVPANS